MITVLRQIIPTLRELLDKEERLSSWLIRDVRVTGTSVAWINHAVALTNIWAVGQVCR